MKKEERHMMTLKRLLSKWQIVFMVIFIAVICLFILDNKQTNITIKESDLFSKASSEVEINYGNHQSYSITNNVYTIDKENFVAKESIIHFPTIKMTGDKNKEEKVNQMLIEMVKLNYQTRLEQEVNAVYNCRYVITYADEKLFCILFITTLGSGMGRPVTYADAITISVQTGEKISLDKFTNINRLMKKIDNYNGIVYVYSYFEEQQWKKNKKELIETWKEKENSKYNGYYLYNGRLGLLFDYYQMGEVKAPLEFEVIDD